MPDFTTVNSVCSMFPTFKRGIPQQQPSDAQIQTFISDITGRLNALLIRRFGEAIDTPPYSGSLAAWIAALSADALNILEQVERYGVAAQLARTFSTMGLANAQQVAKSLDDEFRQLWGDIDARDLAGRPMASGPYDKLFDVEARTETPRPGLQAISGGDQPPDQTAQDVGLTGMMFSIGQKV